MGTNTKATKAAHTPATTGSVYRTTAAWQAAYGAATGVATGNPAYRAALQVACHLAWRAPQGAVAWHNGTNANMVAAATGYGATTGTPVHTAMAATLAALQAAAANPAQVAAAAALVAAT